MYEIKDRQAIPVVETTFSRLGMNEHDVEELIRKNPNLIIDEESLLIIGQQVRNASGGICDLVALNSMGDMVLIEIKRDRKDIEARREAFEFQAIRYAAAFAKIKDIDDLVAKIYSPYLEKTNQGVGQSLTITELANRNLEVFFADNEITLEDFNQRQQIILVASDFDEQTLSAVAWLNSNGVLLSCIRLIPYEIDEQLYIQTEKILPLVHYEDYYVDVLEKTSKIKRKRDSIRRHLPRIDSMLEWGVVKAGDTLQAKNQQATATLLQNGNVIADEEEKSLQQWLQEVTGWPSVQTYAQTVHVEKGKTLSEIRSEYMEKHGL